MKAIRTARLGYIIAAIIFCMAGIILMTYPEASVTVICHLMGIFLILYGIIKVIGYFSKDLYRLAFQFDLALGILFLTIGLVMLIYPKWVVSFLHFVIGIIIFLDGLFKIQIAADAKRFGLGKWWIITMISILVSVFGLALIINPNEGARLNMELIGFAFLLEGILNLCVAIYTIKYQKQNNPDVLDYNNKGDRDD